ncbi:MAG TPA: hypothetical protein DCE78_00940 [Bacteroidetes bacterium]|nr:hypothetical protein [Bacteroidota bacterium]
MKTIFKLIPGILAFIYSFKSTKLLTLIAFIGILVFTLGTKHIDGIGLASTISIFGTSIPSMFIFVSFNSIFLFSTLAVVMITFQFCEFLLFGHFSQTIVGAYKNRYELIIAYLFSALIFIVPIGISYTSYYFWMSPNMNTFLFSVINSILYFYSILLITTFILNINSLKKYALVMIVLFFFVIPGTLTIAIPMISGDSFLSKVLVEFLNASKNVLYIHNAFSTGIDFVQQRSFVRYESLLQPVGIVILYMTAIVLIFKKKSFT